MKINILSWNIWCDCYFDKVADFLNATDADIIGLQEVALDDPGRDVVTVLKKRGYGHVLAPSAEFTDDKNVHHKLNNAIFSKFPIVGSKPHKLRDDGKRSIIEAQIDVNGKILTIFSIHLKHAHLQPLKMQDEQAETLQKLLPPKLGIVMGDFNALPESYPIQLMKQKYMNTDPSHAPTWSMYPEGCEVCKPQKLDACLDYIFVSPDLEFESAKVEMSKGSDHLPISVSVRV